MIDLDAAIVPGKSAAGIAVGADVRDLLALNRPSATTQQSDYRVHDFGPIRVWSSCNVIQQVGVYSGYRGSLDNKIHVGTTIGDVERLFGGEVQEDLEDNLIVSNSAGWCFETEQWKSPNLKENRGAQITAIFIFQESGRASGPRSLL